MPAILAIDAGTTGITALVVDESATIIARGYREFPQHFPADGWVEHDLGEMWSATLAATRLALADLAAVSPGTELVAVGITNQRETVCLWDRETLGSPRRAIVWQDRRTASLCETLREDGHEPLVVERTGLRLDPYFSATKLSWIRAHEPHIWASVESGRTAVGTVDSYLVARMSRGLHHVTDATNASRTLLYDLESGAWDEQLCALFGVPMSALPEVVAVLRQPRAHRSHGVPRPRPAHHRHRRRPAGRPRRPGGLHPRRGQVHLRHRVVPARPHRRPDPALGPRPAHDRRPRPPRRPTRLRPRGRGVRHRRRGAVAARRARHHRVGRRGGGPRGQRARLRRRRLRAGADRTRRTGVGPDRPRA